MRSTFGHEVKLFSCTTIHHITARHTEKHAREGGRDLKVMSATEQTTSGYGRGLLWGRVAQGALVGMSAEHGKGRTTLLEATRARNER